MAHSSSSANSCPFTPKSDDVIPWHIRDVIVEHYAHFFRGRGRGSMFPTRSVEPRSSDNNCDARNRGGTPSRSRDDPILLLQYLDHQDEASATVLLAHSAAAPVFLTQPCPRRGETVLHKCARHGYVDLVVVVAQLIGTRTRQDTIGSFLRQSNICGDTPYHIALLRGNLPTARLLLELEHQEEDLSAGLVVTQSTSTSRRSCSTIHYRTPLKGNTLLDEAAAQGCLETAQWALQRGARVHDQCPYGGWSALHHAAHRGQVAMVQWLLQQGADPACSTWYAGTAVDLARKQRHDDCVAVLMPAGGAATTPATSTTAATATTTTNFEPIAASSFL